MRLEGYVFADDNAAADLVPIRHHFARVADKVTNWLFRFDERQGEGRSAGFVVNPDRGRPDIDADLVPLVRSFDSGRYDALSTTVARLLDDANAPLPVVWNSYREPTRLVWIFSPDAPQPAGTLPLWRWFSPSRFDHDTTTHHSWQFSV